MTPTPSPLFQPKSALEENWAESEIKNALRAGESKASHAVIQSTAVKTIRSGARDADGNLPPEVWQENDLAPILNSMDNTGESRATVIAFSAGNSSKSYGLGITQDGTPPLRAGASGTNQVPTIAFTAQRVGEAPRIYEDSTPALLSRMGTGGNNTPMVSQPVNFDEYNFTGGEDIHHPIRAGTRQSTGVMQPIHSFDTQFGSNANVFNDMSPTLQSSQNAPSVQHEYAVRRLTPLECERLMGWPDDHTRWTAEGKEQSDSARYKQCGNGVATPVARWVAEQIGGIL